MIIIIISVANKALKMHFSGNTESWSKIWGRFLEKVNSFHVTEIKLHYVLKGLNAAVYQGARKSALSNCGVSVFCMSDNEMESASTQIGSNQKCSPTVSVLKMQRREK